TGRGREVGLVDDARWARFESRRDRIECLRAEVKDTRVQGETLERRLRRPETEGHEVVALHPPLADPSTDVDAVQPVMIECKYGGYITRQAEQADRFRRLEHKAIPAHLDYQAVPQLRAEAREKLAKFCPRSLGQAGRISGISPADVATLLVHLKRNHEAP